MPLRMRLALPSLPLTLVLLAIQPASASFHLMQIEQVIGGVNGNTTAQAIQLRMRFGFENQVQGARLIARDAAGNNPVIVIDFTAPAPLQGAGLRILAATASFQSQTSPPLVPDYIMTNPIPASYLAAGTLTYEQDPPTSTILWRLSWGGASYTGPGTGSTINDADGNFNPPFAGPCPSSTTQALLFHFAANAGSTNNANDYLLTAGSAVFVNNLGASGTVVGPPPAGACCLADGICVLAINLSDCSSMSGQFHGSGTNCSDADGDGIPDILENNNCALPYIRTDLCNTRTSPFTNDTDGDGFLDGEEVYAYGTNPCVPDSDCNSNGRPDAVELANGSRQDRNGNGILDICEYPACTGSDGDTNGDGLVNGLDIQRWTDCLVGNVSECQCCDMDDDGRITTADLDVFVAVLLQNVGHGPRCDNCQPVNTTFWECHHWADDNNGAPCSTKLCIENTINTASCDFHPDQDGAKMCNTNTATGAKFVQRIHTATCAGGNVNWVIGYDFTVGCTVCADNSIYVSCVVGGCTANLLRGPFDRGTRHQCGCP